MAQNENFLGGRNGKKSGVQAIYEEIPHPYRLFPTQHPFSGMVKKGDFPY